VTDAKSGASSYYPQGELAFLFNDKGEISGAPQRDGYEEISRTPLLRPTTPLTAIAGVGSTALLWVESRAQR
jgi:hypothetical protein